MGIPLSCCCCLNKKKKHAVAEFFNFRRQNQMRRKVQGWKHEKALKVLPKDEIDSEASDSDSSNIYYWWDHLDDRSRGSEDIKHMSDRTAHIYARFGAEMVRQSKRTAGRKRKKKFCHQRDSSAGHTKYVGTERDDAGHTKYVHIGGGKTMHFGGPGKTQYVSGPEEKTPDDGTAAGDINPVKQTIQPTNRNHLVTSVSVKGSPRKAKSIEDGEQSVTLTTGGKTMNGNRDQKSGPTTTTTSTTERTSTSG